MTLVLDQIPNPTAGQVFTVSGSYMPVALAGLQYADANAAFVNMPAPIGTMHFSFLHPAVNTVGALTIRVRYPAFTSQVATAAVTVLAKPAVKEFDPEFDKPFE